MTVEMWYNSWLLPESKNFKIETNVIEGNSNEVVCRNAEEWETSRPLVEVQFKMIINQIKSVLEIIVQGKGENLYPIPTGKLNGNFRLLFKYY